jgi:DNA repair protein RadC
LRALGPLGIEALFLQRKETDTTMYVREIECKYKKTDVGEDEVPVEVMSSSQDVYRAFRHLGDSPKEQFMTVLLNTKNRIIGFEGIGVGTEQVCPVTASCVFRAAINCGATAVLFVHCHPSGDPTPSAEDRRLTERLKDAGKLLGIEVLDHIIIGSGRYHSFADNKEL